MEIERVHAPLRRDGAGQRRGERTAARPGLQHDAPGDELEVGHHEADVGDVEDLRAVAEHERPELRGGREEVDEPAAGLASELAPAAAAAAAGGAAEDLGSEVAAEPVGVAEDPEPVLQHAVGGDGDGAHRVVALVHHDGVAHRYAALRGGLVRWIERNHHRDSGAATGGGGGGGRACLSLQYFV